MLDLYWSSFSSSVLFLIGDVMGAISSLMIGVFNAYIAIECFKGDGRWSKPLGWANLVCSAANLAMFLKEVL